MKYEIDTNSIHVGSFSDGEPNLTTKLIVFLKLVWARIISKPRAAALISVAVVACFAGTSYGLYLSAHKSAITISKNSTKSGQPAYTISSNSTGSSVPTSTNKTSSVTSTTKTTS